MHYFFRSVQGKSIDRGAWVPVIFSDTLELQRYPCTPDVVGWFGLWPSCWQLLLLLCSLLLFLDIMWTPTFLKSSKVPRVLGLGCQQKLSKRIQILGKRCFSNTCTVRTTCSTCNLLFEYVNKNSVNNKGWDGMGWCNRQNIVEFKYIWIRISYVL